MEGPTTTPQLDNLYQHIKKMLVHVELKDSTNGNCTAVEQISILNCSSAEERINKTSGLNTLLNESNSGTINEDADSSDFTESQFQLSNFSFHAVAHVAGYIVKKIIQSINCNICVNRKIRIFIN